MEVISSEKQEECEEFIKDWFKKIFNIKYEVEIKSVIIYSKNEKIYEINFKDDK